MPNKVVSQQDFDDSNKYFKGIMEIMLRIGENHLTFKHNTCRMSIKSTMKYKDGDPVYDENEEPYGVKNEI